LGFFTRIEIGIVVHRPIEFLKGFPGAALMFVRDENPTFER
jgi:hypothetical protein